MSCAGLELLVHVVMVRVPPLCIPPDFNPIDPTFSKIKKGNAEGRAAFLDDLANASDFVNCGVVDDKHRVWNWPFVHVRERSLNVSPKEVIGRRILDDLEVEYTIEGYGRENRVQSTFS